MSEVFLGQAPSGAKVAIKILRTYLKNNEKYAERIHQEAKNLSLLSDERIVRFIELTETSDGRLALVFELVQGLDLEKVIQADSACPRPVVAVSVVSEILLGLEEAHRHQIVHRDLKPENIMLTFEGRIKITDFGVAKNLELQDVTSTGLIIGSPAYMSP